MQEVELREIPIETKARQRGAGLNQDGAHHHIVEELWKLWLHATPDTISEDLSRAEELATLAPASESEQVQKYLSAMQRLRDWLQDR